MTSDAETGDSEDASDDITAGLRVRPRLAAVDRFDLNLIVGVTHTRSMDTLIRFPGESDEETTDSSSFTTTGLVGIGVEYWIAPRLSLAAELDDNVIAVATSASGEESSTTLTIRTSPGGGRVFRMYF